METLAPQTEALISAEDQVRADLYALLARLFFAPPDASLLHALAAADELVGSAEEAPLAMAWARLQAIAAVMPPEAVRVEFDVLFIDVGSAALQPYASYYLSGFQMERPLAELRGDLAKLGLARLPEVSEPEDHIASLADVMRFLIAGDGQTPPADLAAQQRFFRRHIQPWYQRLAADIQKNEHASFYRSVAELMQAFFAIEVEAFEMS